jgi:predicted glutamine amidotransferase
VCRLFGAAGPPTEAGLPTWEHLIGAPHALRVQARLGCVLNPDNPGHTDSWGIGWFDASGRRSVLRQTGSAEQSPSFVFAAELASKKQAGSGPAVSLVGHLRKASCGAVTTENAHPITAGPFLVIHNGTIHSELLNTLRTDLASALHSDAHSDNDTVVLAAWLGELAGAASDRFSALNEALAELLSRAARVEDPYSALNLLIAAPEGLYALRQFTNNADYYTLYARELSAGGWIAASEPTDSVAGWEPLTPGRLELFGSDGNRVN